MDDDVEAAHPGRKLSRLGGPARPCATLSTFKSFVLPAIRGPQHAPVFHSMPIALCCLFRPCRCPSRPMCVPNAGPLTRTARVDTAVRMATGAESTPSNRTRTAGRTTTARTSALAFAVCAGAEPYQTTRTVTMRTAGGSLAQSGRRLVLDFSLLSAAFSLPFLDIPLPVRCHWPGATTLAPQAAPARTAKTAADRPVRFHRLGY